MTDIVFNIIVRCELIEIVINNRFVFPMNFVSSLISVVKFLEHSHEFLGIIWFVDNHCVMKELICRFFGCGTLDNCFGFLIEIYWLKGLPV